MTQHTEAQPAAERGAASVVATVVAAAAMLVVGFFYGVSGLMVPEWVVVALAVVWLGLVVGLVILARRRTFAVLAIPIIAAVIWVLAVWFSDVVLGVTA